MDDSIRERLARDGRHFNLTNEIHDKGSELGEVRFEQYLATLTLSEEDIEAISCFLKIRGDMAKNHSSYCIRKLKQAASHA